MRFWSAGVCRETSAALTGTKDRMKNLPVITHSVQNNSNEEERNEDLFFSPISYPSHYSITSYQHLEGMKYRSEHFTSRCVYNYEDRYSFSRVLSNTDLLFDSHFESGNLFQAKRIFYGDEQRDNLESYHEYDLEMHHDIHSIGHTQWFYFSVSNTIPGMQVKFNIINFSKKESLFQSGGMKPLMLSDEELGWRRVGENIKYYANQPQKKQKQSKKKKKNPKKFYVLSFTYSFTEPNDKYYFSGGYPYTYTDLQTYLYNCQKSEEKSKFIRRTLMCKTLSGNNCDMLTITEPTNSLEELNKRKGVVVTARVHPGESNASFICEGIIDFLLGNDEVAKQLRSKHVFKIVPMLNPDGVINGNYRTSMAGVDLNRRWNNPDCDLHPTIYHTKEMIRKLQDTREVVTVCDIHGHSRKEGLFMYGCTPSYCSDVAHKKDVFTKILSFPAVFDSVSRGYFELNNCSFDMHRDKISTMRMVMFQELGIICSYTLEASFSGIHGKHFSVKDLKKMGQQFCLTLDEFTNCFSNSSTSVKAPRPLLHSRCGIYSIKNKTNKTNTKNNNKVQESRETGVEINDENNTPTTDVNKEKRIPFIFELLSDFHRKFYIMEPNENNCFTFMKEESNGLRSDHHSDNMDNINNNMRSIKNNGFDGSDSNPSEDNLSEEEVMKLLCKTNGTDEKRQKTKTKKKRNKKKKGTALPGINKKKNSRRIKLPLQDNNGVSKVAESKYEVGIDENGKNTVALVTFPRLLNKPTKPSSSRRKNRPKTVCSSYWSGVSENKAPNKVEATSKNLSKVNLSLEK